ncbi:MAG: hypothetical protein ACYTHJ_00040 [Planctomycetota bacterium]|jgi:hypothetical protein
MTTAGWVIMITSISAVVALISFCFVKVLGKPSSTDRMHTPLEIDTGDKDT